MGRLDAAQVVELVRLPEDIEISRALGALHDGDGVIPPHIPASIVARMSVDNPLETFPRLGPRLGLTARA